MRHLDVRVVAELPGGECRTVAVDHPVRRATGGLITCPLERQVDVAGAGGEHLDGQQGSNGQISLGEVSAPSHEQGGLHHGVLLESAVEARPDPQPFQSPRSHQSSQPHQPHQPRLSRCEHERLLDTSETRLATPCNGRNCRTLSLGSCACRRHRPAPSTSPLSVPPSARAPSSAARRTHDRARCSSSRSRTTAGTSTRWSRAVAVEPTRPPWCSSRWTNPTTTTSTPTAPAPSASTASTWRR